MNNTNNSSTNSTNSSSNSNSNSNTNSNSNSNSNSNLSTTDSGLNVAAVAAAAAAASLVANNTATVIFKGSPCHDREQQLLSASTYTGTTPTATVAAAGGTYENRRTLRSSIRGMNMGQKLSGSAKAAAAAAAAANQRNNNNNNNNDVLQPFKPVRIVFSLIFA